MSEAKAPKRTLKTLVLDIEEKVFTLTTIFGLDVQADDENSILASGVNISLNAVMERLDKVDAELDSINKAAISTADLVG